MSNNKCGCGISNDSQEHEILKYYQMKDYEKLASSDLKQPVNANGDTIIHIIAKNLDKNAFESIRKYNPKALNYTVINTPNKLSEFPIHHALKTIKKNRLMEYDFIDYMINELGAKSDIPDIRNRIIVSESDSEEKKISYNIDNRIKKLNDIVIRNIQNLTKLAESNIDNISNAISDVLRNSGNNDSKNNTEFVKNITNYYNNLEKQVGGYKGRRKIPHRFTNWRNTYDSFIATNKNKILNDYIDNMKDDIRRIDEWKKERDRYKLEEKRLKLEEEKIRNFRLFGGKENKEIREREIKLMERRKELMDEYDNTIGGKRYKKKKGNTKIEKKRQKRSNVKNFNTDSIENLFSDDTTTDTDLQRVRNIMKFDTDKKDDEETDEEDDTFSRRQTSDYQERLRRRRFRRDYKLTEIYNSFVKKIMDLLDVDENTAKFYRSAIKINIENANPELRKWENDALKIKEMEKIFENKEKLQETLDNIDMDQMKKFMEERREISEKRREERRKMREAKRKEREEKNNRDTTTKSHQEVESEDKPKKKSTKKTSDIKEKKTKKTKQSRIVENGYIQSDEIIFSPSM